MKSKLFLTLVNERIDNEGTINLFWRIRPYNDDYRALQDEVEGHFQSFQFSAELDTLSIKPWVNEDGIAKKLPPTLSYVDSFGEESCLLGNICFLKVNDFGKVSGLSNEEANEVTKIINRYIGTFAQIKNNKFIEAAEEMKSFGKIEETGDFQCHETLGFPTRLVWSEEKEIAWLEPALEQEMSDEDIEKCWEQCEKYGFVTCCGEEDFTRILKSLVGPDDYTLYWMG